RRSFRSFLGGGAMRLKRILVLGASMVALSLVITSCGSTGGPSSSAKATIRIASFNFSESIILAHIYGDALKNKGYTITYRDKLGNREIVEPSLENGLIDLYAGYAATDLNFADKRQNADLEAGTDAAANVQKINTRLASKGTLGGPPECPSRPFCQPGLQQTYGLKFKAFKSLDTGGPLTFAALKQGSINIGLVFSSDGGITANNFVVLDDDKHLQQAD